MSICWWGFSSTSRFHDVIPNDVKGETIHPERRLAPCFNTRPRCILMLGVSRILALFFAYSELLALPFNNTSRLASIHRTGKLFHGRGIWGFATESRDTDCTILANQMSDNSTHSDVTVDNLELSELHNQGTGPEKCETEDFTTFNGG